MKTLVVGVLACFFVTPATALAGQSQTASRAGGEVRVATLDELRRELSPGDFISVVQTAGDAVRGRLRRFGDTDLDLQVETQQAPPEQRRPLDLKIPLIAIQSLERPRDSSRNGALIGAGIGGGLSLAMFVYAEQSPCSRGARAWRWFCRSEKGRSSRSENDGDEGSFAAV